jgi:hypothetical protein
MLFMFSTEAVRATFRDTTDSTVESHLRNWLGGARDRNGGRQERMGAHKKVSEEVSQEDAEYSGDGST